MGVNERERDALGGGGGGGGEEIERGEGDLGYV